MKLNSYYFIEVISISYKLSILLFLLVCVCVRQFAYASWWKYLMEDRTEEGYIIKHIWKFAHLLMIEVKQQILRCEQWIYSKRWSGII